MTQLPPKIPFYTHRTMGEKITASFDFLRENRGVWLKYCAYFLLPVAIVQGVCLFNLFDFINGTTSGNSQTAFLCNAALAYVAASIMNGLIYSMMHDYATRHERLQGFCFARFRKPMLRCFGILLPMAFIGLVAFAIMTVGIFLPGLGLGLLLGFFALLLPLGLVPVVSLFEGLGVWAAFKRAYSLGFKYFGSYFGLCIVLGLVLMLLSTFANLPLTLLAYVLSLFGVSSNLYETPNTILVLRLLFCFSIILEVLVQYLCYSVLLVAVGYHYGSLANDLEDASLDTDIDDFENL